MCNFDAGVLWWGGINDQTTEGYPEPAIFSNLGRDIFGTFRNEANIIMRRHEVPYRLSSDPKMLDFEWPSYAILC